MGFLKKQAEKSVEKKRVALDEALSGEEVVLEFTASMVHPKMTSGVQSSRTSFGAVAKASPTICLITKTRLLIAYKNVHPEGTKISDAAKLMGEPVNVFITSLDDIYDMRRRKQEELAFYNAELEKLILKLDMVRHDINVTNKIIEIIEQERVMDIAELVKKKSI